MKRYLFLLIGLFTLTGTAFAAPTIVLGASVQLTGPLANTGRYYRDAYKFAIDKINDKRRRQGRRRALQAGAEDARQPVRRQSERAPIRPARHPGQGQLPARAVRQRLRAGRLVGRREVRDSDGPGRRRLRPDLRARLQVHLRHAAGGQRLFRQHHRGDGQARSRAPKTVALLYADDAFDVSVAKGTRAHAEEGAVSRSSSDQRYSSNTSDFIVAAVADQVGKTPDVVLVAGHETEVLNFIRQAKSLDVNPEDSTPSPSACRPPISARRSASDANYAFGMTPWLPSAALKDDWFGDAETICRRVSRSKFGYEPDYHAASGRRRRRGLRQGHRERRQRSIRRRCATPSPRSTSTASTATSSSTPRARSTCRRS